MSAYQYFPGDDDYTVANGDDIVTALLVRRGGSVTLTNLDVNFQSHSLTADEIDASEIPIFDSGPLLGSRSTEVAGIEDLAPGVYGFHCRLHDWVMHGYLQVV